MVAGLGENQDTPSKRIDSWKKGYTKGQPDLMIVNYHKYNNGLCIELKSPTNIYQISVAQREMKERYKENCYKFILMTMIKFVSKYINIWMVFVSLVNTAKEHSLIKKH